jgi:hypothetical protein
MFLIVYVLESMMEITHSSNQAKGLGKMTPAHLLFNLVIDVFTRMLMKASSKGYLTGLLSSMCPDGILSLQYVDDTLLFLKPYYQAACHLKWLMVCFEKLSGMKINYSKSDLTAINLEESERNNYARIFCCKMGNFPFKYLEVPLHYEKLRREDIQLIVNKIIKRISCWKGKLLSYGARLTLLRACLASIPIYLMSVIKFSKWMVEAINSQMANFFWNDQENNRKYHLFNWQSLTKKEHGGLGGLA